MLIDGKQLKDLSITAAKLAASVLAPYLKADGSVALTGNINAGGTYTIVSLPAPTAPDQPARLQDVYNIPWKDKVITATTANITLSGTQTIDGVAVAVGDRVLVRAQTSAAQNGIYVVASGAWARAADADSAAELRGAMVYVEQGTTQADKRYALSTDNITLGTTALNWVDTGAGPVGAYDVTSNKGMTASATSADFQLACATPIAATPTGDGYVRVMVNGLGVTVGDGVKTKDCYFSADSGTTAKTIANIAANDSLYWVGSVAGFQLAATDVIDFDYAV